VNTQLKAQSARPDVKDDLAASLRETRDVLQRLYDLTGNVELQPVLDRANAALRRSAPMVRRERSHGPLKRSPDGTTASPVHRD
jgi:hypothetical protein